MTDTPTIWQRLELDPKTATNEEIEKAIFGRWNEVSLVDLLNAVADRAREAGERRMWEKMRHNCRSYRGSSPANCNCRAVDKSWVAQACAFATCPLRGKE